VKALKQAVLSNEKALESSEAGYDVGTRTTVDVLNARRNLFSARRDHARARYEYILDTLRLKQAAGIADLDDIKQINTWLQSDS
jgi:outer membrane protein